MNATMNIPAGWKKSELGDLLGERKKKVTPTAGDDRAYVALEHMATDAVALLGHDRAGSATSAKTIFNEGDLLFGKLRPNLRKCVMAPFDGVCSTDILALHAKNGAVPSFLLSLLHSARVMGFAKRTAIGTKMPRTSWEQLSQCAVLVPPKPEQIWIAEMLDSVDAAIDATRGVIEQARRLKTAVLQDLLTRGLPGRHSEFREVKGLGQVPRAWKVTPLAKLIDADRPICYGILMPGRGHPGGVPVVKVKDLADGRIKLDDILLTTPALDEEYKRSRLRQGDILVSIRGTTGRIASVPAELHDGNITQDTARLSMSDECVRDFVFYCLQTREHQAYIQHHTIGQAVKGINIGEVRKIPIPLPGADERQPIVQMLRALDRRIESEQATLAQQTKEKTALSQALLTGRVRVPAAKGVVA
ncbi:MAG: hypothetical protein Tsb0013_03080 [Phycisphaerales bacterium]